MAFTSVTDGDVAGGNTGLYQTLVLSDTHGYVLNRSDDDI
jgi:hypothetical protein